MPDQPTATYAVWPGAAFVVARVECSKHGDGGSWYLGNIETGRVSELVEYRYGMLRGVERR